MGISAETEAAIRNAAHTNNTKFLIMRNSPCFWVFELLGEDRKLTVRLEPYGAFPGKSLYGFGKENIPVEIGYRVRGLSNDDCPPAERQNCPDWIEPTVASLRPRRIRCMIPNVDERCEN
jgi:hypothetical protein